MADKPKTADGYPAEQVELVRQTCLYLATKLLMEDLVVVGGLVPVKPARRHVTCRSVGSLDGGQTRVYTPAILAVSSGN